MTRLVNDPAQFADEALSGYAVANAYYIKKVHGGVVRATTSPKGQVAVVVGGGTGHYPAFAGWVGPGFAHAATCGNIFASPSASQIYSVAQHADNGGGVIFGFGNYTGDKLHFGLAAEQLRNNGVDVRLLTITDDIASGQSEFKSQRRGIAGDLAVLKIMCSAAESGLDINEVERIGRKANAATSSLGIAFSGCTLPGAEAPLFTVLDKTMAVGMGIHGERGISELPMGSAAQVANILLDAVLNDQQWQPGQKVAVILNGLGTIKYEELFVVYNTVHQRLASMHLQPVNPLVGEYVTSLDMGGLSLTITRLDSELEQHWSAPCDTPAFKVGSSIPQRKLKPVKDFDLHVPVLVTGSAESHRFAKLILLSLRQAKAIIISNADYLGNIDAIAGDGDHGIGMTRGASAAVQAAELAYKNHAGAQGLLCAAADAWAEYAGGTSGALWGAGLNAMAREFGNKEKITDKKIITAVHAFVDSIIKIGGANVGDKTMIDSAAPFANELECSFSSLKNLSGALSRAVVVACDSAQHTATFCAKLGRARVHGEQSIGTPDAGAVSFTLIVSAIADALSDTK